MEYLKLGDGTRELAENFGKDCVSVALDIDVDDYWGSHLQEGDIPLNWYIIAQSDLLPEVGCVHIYIGKALMRNGKVHFYDRYPLGGGPFRVSDFTNPDFRRRSERIAENIEALFNE